MIIVNNIDVSAKKEINFMSVELSELDRKCAPTILC